jgi:pimeloyl-ACP methyl ester carboxylesterase/DNA-binding CsgD family transcriptional regulator
MRQTVRFLNTEDEVTLAWAETGRGPPLIRASNWLTHLEYDWESPVWRHWTEFLARHFRYVRYDERGCGMTDWKVGDLSLERWVQDLSAVVEAAKVRQPMILFGVSQGAAVAITYAVKHPERVSHLVLHGGYPVGAKYRDDTSHVRAYRAMQDLARVGWDKDNPVFRQVFTSRFIPEGTEEQIHWFNELCKRTTTPEIAYRLLEARAEVDVRDLLEKVRAPTLVLHSIGDEVIPVSQGRWLAREIPSAEFVPLNSRNHVLLEHEPAWQDFKSAILQFTGVADEASTASGLTGTLTQRERQVFDLLCEGLANARIAEELSISEKTVRNHLSRLYEKLGVRSRSEALVLAHKHGIPR